MGGWRRTWRVGYNPHDVAHYLIPGCSSACLRRTSSCCRDAGTFSRGLERAAGAMRAGSTGRSSCSFTPWRRATILAMTRSATLTAGCLTAMRRSSWTGTGSRSCTTLRSSTGRRSSQQSLARSLRQPLPLAAGQAGGAVYEQGGHPADCRAGADGAAAAGVGGDQGEGAGSGAAAGHGADAGGGDAAAENELSSLILGFAQKLASDGFGSRLRKRQFPVRIAASTAGFMEGSVDLCGAGGVVDASRCCPGWRPRRCSCTGSRSTIMRTSWRRPRCGSAICSGWHGNGFGFPEEPILKPLDNIRQMDAILAYDGGEGGQEPAWPAAEVIVGNPPFLGDKRMISELGEEYADAIRSLYSPRVAGGADLVTYWFEKARANRGWSYTTVRGLLATQLIALD